MKTFLIAAVAASLVAGPALAAPQGYGHQTQGRYEQRGPSPKVVKHVQVTKYRQAKRWKRGERFDRRHANRYRVVSNPRAYRLREAPRGYRWVQSDRDAVMIAITSGVIAAVIANAFN